MSTGSSTVNVSTKAPLVVAAHPTCVGHSRVAGSTFGRGHAFCLLLFLWCKCALIVRETASQSARGGRKHAYLLLAERLWRVAAWRMPVRRRANANARARENPHVRDRVNN
eukprot:2318227-Rhodomonas_salina.6